MSQITHYEVLDVSFQATTEEIKQAYRRLAKLFHPDSKSKTADPEKIILVNAAYEVLGDPKRRRCYDQQLRYSQFQPEHYNRQQRTADAQHSYQRYRYTSKHADAHLSDWFKLVYRPVNQLISSILNPLETQLNELSADPFDDELMSQFQIYLEDCRYYLDQAQLAFTSQPNPSNVAGAAANLYYCLNQLGDGIEELEFFSLNYDDYYLHTGQELFRIANNLRREAQEAVKDLA
ncbi:MAG: J domain-containing protein [Symploca sp. SIO1C4]|uniref:J domain-containing protein n=1 Tax=Symploca sp. SIO1C4 TaxID=2607765 RepID=A0A6B3N797_9CYAN|nr:J domain-containing protein [Symploca sp. SIO1C4]NET03726.1 J domain-containing protein [Symploca sp. SIO2B6]